MAGMAGLVSAGVGLFGSLSGKSNANQVQMPQGFQMPPGYMRDAAVNAFDRIGGLPGQDIPGQVLEQYQQILWWSV